MIQTDTELRFVRYRRVQYVSVEDLLAWLRRNGLKALHSGNEEAYEAVKEIVRVIERDTP